MSTLSVPLPSHLEKMVADMAKARGSNKAEVVRHALIRLAEEEAVHAVLRAGKEPILKGDLRELAKKIK